MTMKGSCLCGAIQYEVSADVTELRACHCTNCQKASGAGGSVNAPIKSGDFRLLKGKPKLYAGKADSGRTLNRFFCGDCGSPIYSQRENAPEMMMLRIGGVDNAGPMKIAAHIWTKSKRPWSYIDPAAAQNPAQPG